MKIIFFLFGKLLKKHFYGNQSKLIWQFEMYE